MIVGYCRTSTAEQVAGLEAQERDLRAAGAERLFSEQISSMAPRSALQQALAFVREGDAFMVSKPDRLARNTAELLTIEADLSRRGIGLVILSMGGQVLDTRHPTSRLMLTILAGVAEWERLMMLERQREGIAKARAEGRYQGRAPTVRRQGAAIRALVAAGEKPTHVAKRLGIARSSVYRMLEAEPAPERQPIVVETEETAQPVRQVVYYEADASEPVRQFVHIDEGPSLPAPWEPQGQHRKATTPSRPRSRKP